MGKLWTKPEVRVLINGLDAAGKTTLLYQAKLGDVVSTIPTIGFNVETIEYKKLRITAWDIGGRDKARALFHHYLVNTQAFIYVVDSNDVERLPEAKDYLLRTVAEDEIRDCPILVLANKQDIPGAMSVQKIAEELDIQKIKQNKCIMPICAKTGDGVWEALDWLYTQLHYNYVKEYSWLCVRSNVSEPTTVAKEPKSNEKSGMEKTVDNSEGLLSPTFVNKLWESVRRTFWV